MILKKHFRNNKPGYSTTGILIVGALVPIILTLFLSAAFNLELQKFNMTANQTVMSVFFEKSIAAKNGLNLSSNVLIQKNTNNAQSLINEDAISRLKNKLSQELFEFTTIDSTVLSQLQKQGIFTEYNYRFSITKLKLELGDSLVNVIGEDGLIKQLELFNRGMADGANSVTHSFFFYTGNDYIEITLTSFFPAKFHAALSAMSDKIIISILVLALTLLLVTLSIRNIIRQKQMADMKSDFIDNITHEFNTPLSTINLVTDILKQQSKNQAIESNATIIKRQVKRLQQMVSNAMDLSMIGNKEQHLNRTPKSVHEIIENTIQEYRLKNKEIHFTTYYTEKDDTLLIDDYYLATAISNLIDNAIKYGKPDDIQITIKTEVISNTFYIWFSNDGPGIPAQEADRIFTKFYRGSGNQSNKKGLGIGLHLVKQAISAHNGTIKLDPQFKEGVRFIIQLPIK